jgi:spermidine synthase
MRPFVTLESITTPDGRTLALLQRDRDFFIQLGGEELMSTWTTGTEEALARLAAEALDTPQPRVLIGGLGLGFTLRAALDAFPGGARIVVAELFSEVVRWNRTHLAHLQGRALGDPRVQIVERDVWTVIADSAEGTWDAILLDVDNGPHAWCLAANRRLYDEPGTRTIRRALAPGGVLGVWATDPDPVYVKRLQKGGFDASSRAVRSHGKKGLRHHIFFARAVRSRPKEREQAAERRSPATRTRT